MSTKKYRSIGATISLVSILIAALILFLSGALYTYKDYNDFKEQTRHSLLQIASIISENSKAAIEFDDNKAANETLNSLRSQRFIVYANLTNPDGNIFAEYSKNNVDKNILKSIEHSLKNKNDVWNSETIGAKHYLTLSKPVKDDSELIGRLYIMYDTAEITKRIMINIMLTTLIFFLGLSLFTAITFVSQRMLTKPITDLAEKVGEISRKKDFALQIDKPKIKNEIEVLINSFNYMLKEVEEKNKQLTHYAFHDPLTDLPNIRLFRETLKNLFSLADRNKSKLAIIFIDIDDFKDINDSFGHDYGDMLLKKLAFNLKQLLRDSDTLASNVEGREKEIDERRSVSRVGGDEFIGVLTNIGTMSDLENVLKRILKETTRPLFVNGKEFYIQMSLGASIYPDHAREINEVVKCADIAMYHTKKQGKNNFAIYTAKMGMAYSEERQISTALLGDPLFEEFSIHYQPIVDIKTSKVIGLEALCRWNSKKLGEIPPDVFIPIAEKNGAIVNFGLWIINQAYTHFSNWLQILSVPDSLKLSINISPFQMIDEFFFENLLEISEKFTIHNDLVVLELTESSFKNHLERIEKQMVLLHEKKFSFAIDDFGTGWSSLSRLSQLPISILKLDKEILWNMDKKEADNKIMKSTLALARSLKLKVVAEGIETEKQHKFLKENNCDLGQGYLFSKPLPVDEMTVYLKKLAILQNDSDRQS